MEKSDQKWLQTTSHNNQMTQQVIQNYFQEWVLGSCSPATIDAKRNDLKKFTLFYQHLNGSLDLPNWTTLDTGKFLKEMENQGYKPATINRTLANLKSLASYLLEKRILTISPVRKIKGPIQEIPQPGGLTDIQIHRLRKAAHKLIQCENCRYHQSYRNMVILETFLGTGLRCSELANLKVDQLIGKKFVGIKCKGGKYRNLIIRNSLKEMIWHYINKFRVGGTSNLFTSYDGHALSRRSIYNTIHKICAHTNVGLPKEELIDIWPHKLRHVHAKRCRDKYGDSYTAKRLGHSSTRYIERYAGHSEQEESSMVENINI